MLLTALAAIVLALTDSSGLASGQQCPDHAAEERSSSSLTGTAAHRRGRDRSGLAIKSLFSHTRTPSQLPTRWSHDESAIEIAPATSASNAI
jgi:hypothetical protein